MTKQSIPQSDRNPTKNRTASDCVESDGTYALVLVKIDEYDFANSTIRATSIREPDKAMDVPFSSILRLAKGFAPGTRVTVKKGTQVEHTADLWFATDDFAFVAPHDPRPDHIPPSQLRLVHPNTLTFDNPQNEKSTWLFAPGCEPSKTQPPRRIHEFYLFDDSATQLDG